MGFLPSFSSVVFIWSTSIDDSFPIFQGFLGIIFWKDSLFNGGCCFSDGGLHVWGVPHGEIGRKKNWWGRVEKKIVARGDAPMPPPLWKTLPPNPTPFSLLLFGKPWSLPMNGVQLHWHMPTNTNIYLDKLSLCVQKFIWQVKNFVLQFAFHKLITNSLMFFYKRYRLFRNFRKDYIILFCHHYRRNV